MVQLYQQHKPKYYNLVKGFRGTIIVIDACVGAGKTTLAKQLGQFLNENGVPTEVYEETVHMPVLALFLSDMKTNAFMFQIHMLSNRQRVYEKAIYEARLCHKCIIIDRGFIGDYAFAFMHKNDGRLTEEQWVAYLSVLEANPKEQPEHLIYLDASADVCMERVNKRDRPGEKSSYNTQYLQHLIDAHKQSIRESKMPVKFIDWNKHTMLHDEVLLDFCKQLHS